MLIITPKPAALTKQQKLDNASRAIRAQCNQIVQSVRITAKNLTGTVSKNPEDITAEEIKAALGDDAEALEKFKEACNTFLAAVENL